MMLRALARADDEYDDDDDDGWGDGCGDEMWRQVWLDAVFARRGYVGTSIYGKGNISERNRLLE